MPKSIVILDDDATLVGLLARILQERGFVARGWHDSKEAIDDILRSKPDLIIVDQEMPETKGLDVVAKVRCLGYRGKVILYSGFGAPDWLPTDVRYLDKGFCQIEPVIQAIVEELNLNPAYASKRARPRNSSARTPRLASRV